MSCTLASTLLTDQQKADICGILSVGCDRQTAADYVGCTLADLRRELQRDSSFLAAVCRAEAAIELTHMRSVQEAATEKKEWRAAVWWLERHAPERFARRAAGALTARQLKAFTALLAEVLHADVQDQRDRERITIRLQSISHNVERLLRDAQSGAAELADVDDFGVNNPTQGDASDPDGRRLLDFESAE
jgi:hypothetical protein